MSQADVLVVGAGPTGLTLALQAHDHGARVRILDHRRESFRPSRAMIVYPRTMEVLRPLGVTDALLARGDRRPTVALHLGAHVIPAGVGDLALPDTAFPHLLLIRQTDVEAVLLAAAADRGLCVEWGTEFETFRIIRGRCVATVRRDGLPTTIESRFLVGADGSTSTVRAAAHISFDGAPYRADVVLADVEITGGDGCRPAHAVAARSGLVFLFPLGEQATWRLLATIPASPSGHSYGQFGPPVPRDELDLLVDRSGLDARITTVAWSSRIRVQHRVASRYRAGPALLAGDAAHTFSPAGGQGMNTGIQDAANLGWKLGLLCARGSSAGPLLTSYETERRPVARMTLALTHLLFWGEAGTGFVPSVLRGAVGPLAAPLVPILLGRRRLTAQGIRLLAQMCWTYRASPLSSSAGRPVTAPFTRPRGHPGDRLRDEAVLVDGGRRHLHELTATAGFKVLLQRGAEQVPVIDGRVQAHRVLSWPGREAVVVRPDGYIGFRGPVPGAIAWLRSLGVDR
jgi:2-polyprenyl-6-methoxyphenol hydroxylase-like FAD-dependent oxidoreductase